MAKKENNDKIIVTYYYRVSTKSEQQKTSFYQYQPAEFQILLEEPQFKNYVRAEKLYSDYGLSGTKLNRPGFVEMLEDAGLDVEIIDNKDIPHPLYPHKTYKQRTYNVSVNPQKKPKFNEIWVRSTSRFARNINAYHILEVLKLAKVYVYFIDRDLTTRREEDMPAIRKSLDEDMAYSEQRRRSSVRTRKFYAKENRVQGDAYGWQYHKRTREKLPYYTIIEKEAEVVRKMHQYVHEGLGVTAISNRFKAEGIVNRDGKPFAHNSILRILRSEKYMGLNYVNKYTTGPLFEKLPSAIVLEEYKGNMAPTEDLPAIVTPEVWYKTNSMLDSRKTRPNDTKGQPAPKHPMKDILVCSHCGNHFVYDNNGGRGFYKCATKRNQKAAACNCANVFQYKLEEFIENLQKGGLQELIENDFEMTVMSLITLIEYYLALYKNPNIITENSEEYQKIIERKESLQKTRENLLEMLVSSTYSQDTFKSFKDKIAEIDEELKTIEEELNQILTPTSDIISKLDDLFSVIFKEITQFNKRKPKYKLDEVLPMLSKIKVYGETENSRGGRPPITILVPLLKTTEEAQGLINAGYGVFKYGFRNGLPTYQAPEEDIFSSHTNHSIEDINPVDRDDLPAYVREKFYTPAPKAKSKWPSNECKYLLAGNAYYTEEGEIGYVENLGVKGISILQQMLNYINKLHQEYIEIKA